MWRRGHRFWQQAADGQVGVSSHPPHCWTSLRSTHRPAGPGTYCLGYRLTSMPAGAGVELIKKAGGEVVEAACVIELPELKGRSKLDGLPLYVLVEREGL